MQLGAAAAVKIAVGGVVGRKGRLAVAVVVAAERGVAVGELKDPW